MTAHRLFVLNCDANSCPRQFSTQRRAPTIDDVRYAATGDGWTHAQLRNGRGRVLDFCPSHSHPRT